MLTKFPKLIKDILKPLPKNDYPVLNTFLFVSCWIGFTLDKSLVSMRDLCTRMNTQGMNVQISTFSKASKIREVDVFEKIIAELNKRLSIKKGVEEARALFPIDSTIRRFLYLCGTANFLPDKLSSLKNVPNQAFIRRN